MGCNETKNVDYPTLMCFFETGNEEQKNYVCIYQDPKTNNWMFTNGYTRQKMPNPTMHNQGDVVALIYFSSEKI